MTTREILAEIDACDLTCGVSRIADLPETDKWGVKIGSNAEIHVARTFEAALLAAWQDYTARVAS